MFKLNLQFFGGRGARSASAGRYAGGGDVNPANIVSTRSLISEREGSQELVDETMEVFKDVYQEYGTVLGDIQLAELKGKEMSTLAYYDHANIAINQAFFNKNMEKAMKDSVKSGFHPKMGNKTAIQAVVAHELGHKLTTDVGVKMGLNGLKDYDAIATQIVKEARKSTKHRGVVQMASKISKYATASNAEAIAEAFSDVYCNGKKAASESKAIMNVVNKYLK